MQKESKTTPLHGRHKAFGANMADFGGYEMPLWYSTAKAEHSAVQTTNTGIFDTSHMAVIMVARPKTYELLQFCFTNDLATCIGKNKGPLSPGRYVYGVYLNEKGEVIDIKDNRRKLTAKIVDEIRTDRTARRPIAEML